jgi:heptosyltransferase II
LQLDEQPADPFFAADERFALQQCRHETRCWYPQSFHAATQKAASTVPFVLFFIFTAMQDFLVIQTAFIGDVVLATGLLEKLHHHFPDANIDVLVRKGNESLLAAHPFVREVLVWNKQENKLKNLWRMGNTIRAKKYTKVINVQRYAATGLLTAFSGAGETIGFDKNPISFLFNTKIKHIIGNGRHEVERNTDLVAAFTNNQVFNPRLYPSLQDQEKVKPLQQKPYLCMAPSSVWFTKKYPTDRWISLIEQTPKHLTTYLLGAPGDKALCDAIAAACPQHEVQNLCGQLGFLASAALMKGAAMNFVNDSAPLHFASAVDAPVTAIYCSTVPKLGYGPLSSQSHVVETPIALPCRPCGLHGHQQCPQKHFNCAYTIEEKQLLQNIPMA